MNKLFRHNDARFVVAKDGPLWVFFPHSHPNGWNDRRPFTGSKENLEPASLQFVQAAKAIAKFPY